MHAGLRRKTVGHSIPQWPQFVRRLGRGLKGAAGVGPAWFEDFFNIQNQLKLAHLKQMPSKCSKILKLGKGLDLNILNNFLNWVDFKFPTEFIP
jgi:hypothetical protein